MREQINKVKKWKQFLNEAYIDEQGNLRDFDFQDKPEKIFYDFDKIKKFVDWFQSEYSEYTTKQGWAIFDSDTEIPNEKYHSERTLNGKILNGYYWQVQRLDNPEDDEALFGKLQNDFKADDLARKLGLMVDEYGVVYGFDGQSFL
jgi:hypothetical protein